MCFCFGSFQQKGLTTPRVFVDYDRLKDLEPRYFEAILRNSLTEDEIRQFCADFLALFRPKEHKQPVLCAIGSADSGKTSLFSPVFQIIPLSRIARVTKQKSFNKAMIDNLTEVIFLDEAYATLLDIDDWKIICQGGFTSHDAKWKKAQGFHCTATMYITCQVEMDFGAAHNQAMDKRLRKYHFKSLPRVEPEANKWLRKHAMDCIVWAHNIVGDSPSSQASTMPTVHESGMPEEELRNILSVSLIDEEVDETAQGDCRREQSRGLLTEPQSREESSEENAIEDVGDSDEDETLTTLKARLAQCSPGSLRHRQLSHMLESHLAEKERLKRVEERCYKKRQHFLQTRGVSVEHVSLLPHDHNEPLPTPIRRDLAAFQEDQEQERIRTAFGKPWLLAMEKEMAEQSERMEDPRDEEERRVMQSLLEINCEKLRCYHERHGTLKLPAALAERKRLCLSNELVDRSCVNFIRDLFSPLPVRVFPPSQRPANLPARSRSSDEDDEECWSAAPKTPTYIPNDDVEAICPPSPGIARAHNPVAATSVKRPHFQSQAHPSKKQMTLTRFMQTSTQP